MLAVVWPAAGAAQAYRQAEAAAGDLLPEVRYLGAPLADPMAPRISVGLMRTTLLATQGPERDPFELADADGAADEYVAAVGVGAVLPLVQLAVWDGGGAILTVEGRVFARFRIELPRRDDMGQDWYVGGAVEAGWPRVAARLGVLHRSSHIGDEFADNTGASRIEFGGEQLDGMVAYDVPGVARLYGGGAWVFRSYLDWEPRLRALRVRDRALLQFGLDREWQPWSDPRFHAFAGADYYSAERTGWHPAFAAAAGVGVRTTRSLRLTVRAFDGMSHMGEFFLTPERYISLEVGARF
ncbi:MAG TPA: DUF1207 domain-containing protein [Longimicrobiales bacterium]|nr:DUF1207 domain-containing protein [Longimicrobiales bacterium]